MDSIGVNLAIFVKFKKKLNSKRHDQVKEKLGHVV